MTELSEDVLDALLAGDAWDLAQVGKLLLRVRQDSVGPASDAWFVLVPEVPNTVPAGSSQATVTFSVAVTGTGEIGGTLTVASPGLTGFSLTLVVNLTTSGPPSFAFIGLPASTQGLPSTVTLTATTPVTSLPTLDELDLRVATTGSTPALAVAGGIVDGTVAQATAKVVVSQADILTAIQILASKGLANPLSGLTTAPVQVAVPEQDPTPAALLDPNVRACVGALLTVAPPAPGTLSLPASTPLHVRLDFSQTTSTYTWHAPGPLSVVAALVLKDSVVKDNLTNHGSLINLRATLPTDVSLVSTVGPPTYTYSASAVVTSLDLMVSTTSVVVNPALPAPDPIRTTNVHIDTLPRGARVALADFDPNLSVQAVAGLEFTDEQGTPAPVGRVAISSKTDAFGVPAPADLPSEASAVSFGAPAVGPTTLTAQAHDLESAHLKLTVAEPTTGRAVTVGHLDLAYAAAHPAVLDLTLGTTTVHGTADRLPSTLTVDLDATVDAATAIAPLHIEAAAGYVASLPIPTLTAKLTQGQPIDTVITATVHDVPTTMKAKLVLNDDVITGDLSMSDDVGSGILTVARTAGQSLLTATTSSIPQWLELELDLRDPDTYGVHYAAVRAIDAVNATYTDSILTSVQSQIPGVPPPDHLAVNVLELPATGADPTEAVQNPLKGRLTLGGNGKVIVEANVPEPVPPIGVATFELTDQTTSTPPVTGAPITFSQCIRRIAGSVGDQLAPLGAPTGRRTYASAPGLRSLELNTLSGLPQTTFGRLSADPVWLVVTFDVPEPVQLDLATDSWPVTHPQASSSWLSATSSPVQDVVLDMSLPADGAQPIDVLTSMALELVPQSVKVEGVLHTFDGSAKLIPDSSGDPDVIAAAHNRRIDLRAILPDRLVVQTGAVEKAPAPIEVTRPPVSPGQWWTGIRVEAAARDLLPVQSTPVTGADVWARVAQNHDAEDAAWTAWQQMDDARGHVRMIDTVTVTTVVPPSKDRKHGLGGGPLGTIEHQISTMEAFGHLPTLAAVEISTASFKNTGSKEPIFVGVDQGSTKAVVVIDDQLDHDGTSPNQIVIEFNDVPEQIAAGITPASDFRENDRMASGVGLRLSRRDRPLRARVRGGWVYGFPHLTPGPVTAGDGTVRPEGLSALELDAALHDLTLDLIRHWSAGPSGEPLHEQATARTALNCRGGVAASGWFVIDRPGDAGASLPGALPSPSGIHLLQSSVNLPDYADLSSLNRLGLQGANGDLYGAALALSAVRQLTLETTALVDEHGATIPVFLADDNTTHQRGIAGLRFGLQAKGLPGPLKITSQQVEPYDWPDAPRFDPVDRLSLVLDKPPPFISAANEHIVTLDAGNGRPRKSGQLILSSGNTGMNGLDGLQNATGPALGTLEVQTVSLNTDTSRFAPTLTSYRGRLVLPGFIRIDSATTIDPSRFPVPGQDPTGLDMPSWDEPIDFSSFHAANHPWVTGSLALTASGIARGAININSAAQPWNSSTVLPTAAPDEIEWGRMQVMDLLLFVPAGASVDASGANPHVAIVQGASGEPNPDDEKKGIGFRIRPDAQLTVGIGTGTAFGKTWDGLTDGSDINPDTFSTIGLFEMSGILSVQAKDVDLTAIWVAAAAALAAQTVGSFFGPIGWIVGDVVGTAILIGGVRICLSVNDPRVRDALTHGSWRLTPDSSKIPAALRPWFEYFGSNGDPGSWHLDTQFWVDLAAISLIALPLTVAGLEALFAWIVQLVVAPFIFIPML